MFFLWDAIGQQISKFNLFRFRTRMHSSRMRTARSSSQVFSSVHAGIHPLGVGLETPLGVGLEIPPGVSLETRPGQTPQFPPGCGPGNLQGLLGYHLQCMLGYHTPMNRMTDRCKNITLPQTSFAGGKNRIFVHVKSLQTRSEYHTVFKTQNNVYRHPS